MSDYIKQLKKILVLKLKGYKIVDKSPSVFQLVKENKVAATIKDQGDFVIVSISGQDFKYDKWYTKPENLANVLINYFSNK